MDCMQYSGEKAVLIIKSRYFTAEMLQVKKKIKTGKIRAEVSESLISKKESTCFK